MFVPKHQFDTRDYFLGYISGTPRTVYGYERSSLLVSEGHPRRKGHYVSGGPFFTVKDSVTVEPTATVEWKAFSSGGSCRLVPSTYPGVSRPTPRPNPSWASEASMLTTYGSIGFAKARPGNPVAGAGQWLAELRDLPSLPGRQLAKLARFRSLGSEYLNVEFGWKPFVSDLQKMYETYRKLNQHLGQLVRDNGRAIRRRRSLGGSTSTEVTNSATFGTLGAFTPTPTQIGTYGRSYYTVTRTVRDNIWFVGSFRYYVPDIGSDQWTRRATRALFGLNPTPELLWNVLPWSWLVDWFSNVGSVVSNLSSNAVDNCVANYAYVMHESEETYDYVAVGEIMPFANDYYRWEQKRISSHGRKTFHTKSRFAASPYGFGVKWDSLSAYQTGILAALGISRSRF